MALPFDRSKPGVWISGGVHVALVLVALFAVASDKLPDADEGIPVEVVTDSQLAEMTKGETSASQVRPDAKPRADRVDPKRQERDPGEAKQDAPAPPKRPAEMKTAAEDTAAPPPPPQRLADATPEPAASAPPPAPPTRPEPPKPDARAEAAAKAEAAKAEAAKATALKLAEARDAEAIEDARREAAEKVAEAKAKAAADAKAKAEAEARTKVAAAARAKAEADAKVAADAKAKAQAEADAKAQAESRAKAQALADAKAKAEVEADAKVEAESKAKAKALAAAKAKADEARARRQAEAADKFSPGDIRQMLAAKAPSQSTGSTGLEVQRTASLGAAAGNGQRLNPSQRSQLVGLLSDQLHRCWQVPIAAQSMDKPPVPTVRVQLKPDGTLLADPVVMNTSGDTLFRTVAESATRATRRCAPLKVPSQFAPFYQDWKDLVVNFDPREAG